MMVILVVSNYQFFIAECKWCNMWGPSVLCTGQGCVPHVTGIHGHQLHWWYGSITKRCNCDDHTTQFYVYDIDRSQLVATRPRRIWYSPIPSQIWSTAHAISLPLLMSYVLMISMYDHIAISYEVYTRVANVILIHSMLITWLCQRHTHNPSMHSSILTIDANSWCDGDCHDWSYPIVHHYIIIDHHLKYATHVWCSPLSSQVHLQYCALHYMTVHHAYIDVIYGNRRYH